VKDETTGNYQYGLAPFDMSQEILRRQSWDNEATPEEVDAIEHLLEQIKKSQTTRGKELSGVQIMAHFPGIHVQPIQARSGPLWLYSGAGDAAKISEDLPVKDLEILVPRFTSLSKKVEVPAFFRVKPFSGTHALPVVSFLLEFLLIFPAYLTFHNLTRNLFVSGHHSISSLAPVPENGEAPKWMIVSDDSQKASVHNCEPVESEKSAGSSEKSAGLMHISDSSHMHSIPPATSP
jgi:hypothetical protein